MRRNVHDTLEMAVEHHRAGRLHRAEALYRKVIEVQPNEADALHLLGVLAHQRGRFDEAERRVRRAIAARGRPAAEFSNTLGNALAAQGRAGEAVRCFEQAIALRPDDSGAHKNLADVLSALDRHDEAAAHYEKVLQLNPGDAAAHNNVGGVFLARRMFREATECFGRAIQLDPNCAEAYSNLGAALRELGLHTQAVNCLGAAIRLRPNLGAPYANLSCVLHQLGAIGDAIRAVETALALDPANASAHSNLGNLLKEQLRFAEAIACYDVALELRPNLHDARWGRALTLFMAGQIERGWEEYECGWAARKRGPGRPFGQPRWDGGPLAGRRLLFWGEQGLGDEIIFASMIPELTAVAACCVVECEMRLVPLFARSFPAAQLIPRSDPPRPSTGRADLQIAAGSAARWLRPSLDRFPRGFPHDKGYLRGDRERVSHWRARLEALGAGLKVGICWRSGLTTGLRGLQGTELRDWGSVLATPGVHFVNLQYDDCRAELAQALARFGVAIHGWRDIDLKQDIDEVAALTTALDLVVSVSTSVAYLAGALGRPVWQLTLTSSGDCWTMGQSYMPWFPSMRLYECSSEQKWEAVLERIAEDLAEASSGMSGSARAEGLTKASGEAEGGPESRLHERSTLLNTD
jgi:tetratricopeptide (TPR) repeat protein